MSTSVKNSSGQIIGYINDAGWVINAHDKSNRKIGYYNTKTNVTYEDNGKRFGDGNLTEALIWRSTGKN